MLYVQTRTCLKNETQKFLRDLKIKTNRSIITRWSDPVIISKKTEIVIGCILMLQWITEWKWKKTEW